MELGELLLTRSEQKLETVSRNIANISTPGFKREAAFADDIARAEQALLSGETQRAGAQGRADLAQGALRLTGATLDLAISGDGFFKARRGDGFFYVRGGQFEKQSDGRVAMANGLILQAGAGEDLILGSTEVEILSDGVVLENGAPIARIGLFSAPGDAVSLGGGLFAAPAQDVSAADGALIRQGMLEASNVNLADEMVVMMDALRQAESGARLVQLYDTLIGQSLSTFGQTSR